MNSFGKTTAEVLGKYHPLFSGFTFAASARSNDSERYTLTHVLVESDPDNDLITRVVATDGRRLHIHEYDAGLFDDDIEIEMLDPGLYEIIAKSKSYIVIAKSDEDLKYPNYRQVMPDYSENVLRWNRDAIHEQTTGKICIRTGALFASEFLADACGIGCAKEREIPVEYWQETPTTPLILKHNLGTAILMPIKFEADGEASDEKEATGSLPHLRIVKDDEEGTEVELLLEES